MIKINLDNIELTNDYRPMDRKEELKMTMKEYERRFFSYYSEYYMDNLSWLTMQWTPIKYYILSVMGAKHKNAEPSDVLLGQVYLNDLKLLHGDFLV